MKTFCKLPLNIKDLLSEDVKHSRLQTCSEKESIDQFLNLLISTSPGEHDYDKEFGCKILILILNESLRVQDGKVSLQNISRRLFLGMKKAYQCGCPSTD